MFNYSPLYNRMRDPWGFYGASIGNPNDFQPYQQVGALDADQANTVGKGLVIGAFAVSAGILAWLFIRRGV